MPTASLRLFAVCLVTAAEGYSSYQAKLPNGGGVANHAGLGHISTGGGGARNAFGSAFASAGRSWTADLCAADTDSDGKTNGEELGDPCCLKAVTGGTSITAVYDNLVTDPSNSAVTTARTYCGVNTCGCSGYTCTATTKIAVGDSSCTACAANTFSGAGDTACSNCPSGKVRASGDSACAAPADCSGDSDCTHGSCTDSKCVCSSGWAGPACDETALFTVAVVTTLGGYSKDTFDILTNRVAFKTGVAANFASSSVAASQMYVTAVADVTGLLASSVKVSFSMMNVAAAAKSTITAALAAADQSTLVTKLKTAGLSETTSASSTSSASEESAGSAGTPVPIESTPAGTGGTAAVDTTAFTTVALNTDLSLKYRTDANSVSVQLTLAKGSGWLAVGTHATSPDTMIGSRVVMGLPGATTPTSVYDLEGKSASMVKVATKQSITAASLTQTSTSTVLSFKCVLGLKAADGDLQLEAATNNLVWAYGSSNTKSAHIARGSQGIDFSGASNTTNSTSPSGLYKSKAIIWLAHGVCMALAWGVMVPTGIVTARHFKGLPGDATWFKRHRAIQMCAVVIAVAGLIFAVVGHGDGIHFTTPHSWVGLFAMLIAFIQPLAICFRGHNPEEGEPKTTYRLAWEITHKWGGRLGAIAAIVNVSLGTFINSSIYIESGAGPNIIILCLFVCMVVVYLYGIYCEMRKQSEARYKVSAH